MKLLDKKKILSESNAQKKEQIDEGVRIAKKVDILREELPRLEKQRADFLAGSQMELDKAIGSRIEKKATLDREIKVAGEELARLRKPLDDEWAKLSEDVVALHKEQEQLDADKNELSKKAKGIEESEKRLDARETAVAERERITGLLNNEAIDLKTEAERISNVTAKEKEEHTKKLEEETAQIAREQKAIEVATNLNEHNKKVLDRREAKVTERERIVEDKYQTLLRSIKRLKK